MGLDIKTLAAAKKNTKASLEGAGAIKGQKGDPGKDGKDAPTIISTDVDENNVLLITLSDGTTLNGGTIKTVSGADGVDGANGTDGIDGKDGENGITPHIDSVTKHWFIGTTDTGIVAEGKDGSDGAQGIKGDKGDAGSQGLQGVQGIKGEKGDKGDKGDTGEQGVQGIQGVQGVKGDKGNDGYPFLIYKEYTNISEFSTSHFPQIGLMFMIKAEDATSFPVYRYTGETASPYSFVTNLSGSEGIKGDKGDRGEKGEQGIQGVKGDKGDKGDKGETGQQGAQGIQGIAGQNGKDGTTYTPTIGTVTSVASTQNPTASVTIDETEKTAKFNFGIPNGKDGTDGFTPTIKENDNNTDDCYCLDITNKDKSFTTPNLMGVISKEYKNKSVGTPVGEIISYMGTIAPENYLICDGTVYQIDDYPILAQHFADNFGSKNYFGGNGTSTFAVPDLRGEFLRGSGTATRNTGSGSTVGIHQNATQILNWGLNPSENTLWIDSNKTVSGGSQSSIDADKNTRLNTSTGKYVSLKNWSGAGGYTMVTTRPTNTSVLYCIKYQPTYWIAPTNLNEDGTA